MWISLILNIPLWFCIYYYLDQVMPSTYGVQKHPLFCCKRSESRSNVEPEHPDPSLDGLSESILDKNDPIILRNLTKKFGNFTAVDNLSMSIKMGEVFTILGHNGAGKTTAIYMLTGMHKTTSGDATVYRNRITKDIHKVQQNLGLC
jgi:ABC-type molybdenum transport system ATPase subunit/photorepair protein PhrA